MDNTDDTREQSQDDDMEEEATAGAEAAVQEKPRAIKKSRRRRKAMPKEIAEDEELHKYWNQRYRLFARFDEGVKLDRGGSKLGSCLAEAFRTEWVKFSFELLCLRSTCSVSTICVFGVSKIVRPIRLLARFVETFLSVWSPEGPYTTRLM